MRNIWQIFKTDWVNILRVPTGILLVLAIILLPGLYDWINIKSVWDPYKNTQGITVAVTSLDKGAVVEGKTLNIGTDLVENLKKNTKLGWKFVTEEEAMRGVEKGDYYASLLVPPDFSAKITGIIEGRLDRPEVIYTVNEKINAIAPKITGSGISAITKQINENFTEAVSESVLKRLKEAGVELQEQLPTIRKIESGIFALESKLPAIHAAGQKVLEVESKLPEITDKAQRIVELEEKLPEITEAAQYVVKLQRYWPQISSAAQEVLVIQQKLPQMKEAVGRIQAADGHFDKVSQTFDEAIERSYKALGIVSAAQGRLTDLDSMASNGVEFADELSAFLKANQEAFQSIAPAVKENLTMLKQIADAVEHVSSRLTNVDWESLPTPEDLQRISDRLAIALRIVDHLGNLLDRLNGYLPSRLLQDKIDRLDAISAKLNTQLQLLAIVKEAMLRNETPPREIVERLHAASAEVSRFLDQLLGRYDSEFVPAINQALEKLRMAASVSSETLQSAKDRLPEIAVILNSAKEGLEFGQEELLRLQAELPAAKTKFREVAETLQRKAEAFEKAVDKAALFVSHDLPKIGEKLDKAAAFVKKDLPAAEAEIVKASNFVKHQLPQVEQGVHHVAGLVRDDLPQLESAVRKAADKLREVEHSNNFAELARLLRGDIRKESEFLASPVKIKENQLYPIPNYGSAMSPFYCVLALWVGATLLISLFRPDADNPTGSYRGYQLYLGRLATFLSIGIMQALCVSLGNIFILKAYAADKLWFVLFAMLVSTVFVTITYTLLSVFGNAGKGIAIVFMVFQFSSSGGTFPVSMTSPFFQAINPFMPFTYAISLLREAVGGILWQTAIKDILFLAGFIAINLFIALALKKPLSSLIKRSSDNAKKTKIIA
ncbi:YhgE/Pip domain-containing protein [Paenibacillus sp. DMB20]|uniref:YhgE/Pip domain-containing protein n=1 Tax=Paenibacillus sp. DMB20 TaxID=1642570 RepID=UPI0006280689|nr:YhgE/Pip domain-containing protein [Paenibacillus sp. DMB20]KKO52238.1 phage infection protein [Paenibacillus sp. DMB20]